MKTFPKILSLFAATSFALFGSARAQLHTYQTQTAYRGSTYTFGDGVDVESGDVTMGQTFSNVSAVASMTYNFFTGSSSTPSAVTSLTATFGEWNGSSFVAGTTLDFGAITIPASDSGQWTNLTNAGGSYSTYNYTFDLRAANSTLVHTTWGYLTSPSKTYALMLTNTTGETTGLALGLTNTNAFAYGATNYNFQDWTFAQIVVAPGTQQLVPEASTVASLAGGVLVMGLVAFRLRQRQQIAVIPVAA